ncbi:Reverse transcriptase [Theobroma cacao]|nr:Reverse transcriptase [Theobroma cacao]
MWSSIENQKIFQSNEFSCAVCSQDKLIIRPSPTKVEIESPMFLERIQGDICGPIHPSCGPFRYFMVLIDASTRWSHVCLLSIRNLAFARLLAQIIRLRAHFSDYAIKTIRLDNAGTKYFSSKNFGCAVYVLIAPPQRINMGPQRRLGIYVGYEYPSIIKYLEPSTGYLFTARFADCHFDETIFPILEGENKQLEKKISCNTLSLSSFDLRTNQCEQEVQKIINLQNIVNQLPDAFTNLQRVTKSHIPATNALIRIDVPEINENEEISINYVMTRKRWNQNEINVDDIFTYNVALNIMKENEDLEPISIEECRYRNDWPMWKDAIKVELNSLAKHKVFGPIIRTPNGVKPVRYKWVFVWNRNEKDEIVRYKAWFIAQGFTQKLDIDYEETYSPVVDAITFQYLISLAIHEKLEMRLMDVVTAYLYGSLDNDIYMKIPEGFKFPEAQNLKS